MYNKPEFVSKIHTVLYGSRCFVNKTLNGMYVNSHFACEKQDATPYKRCFVNIN